MVELVATEAKGEVSWPDRAVRPDRDEYARWMRAVHDVDIDREQVRYEAAIEKIISAASVGGFWSEFLAQRSDLAQSYLGDTGFKLFAFHEDERPQGKSWESFLLKSYRRNVLDNANFPEPPSRGWLLPPAWLNDVHDVVRTVLVVKYLDGVKFLIDALEKIADVAGSEFKSDLQARETGYYAAHTYSSFTVDLPDDEWSLVRFTMKLEVQVTTQLQEVMGKLTHRQYEKRRELPASASANWQWDHKSDSFQPNYLGHILHYAEGMIMEVRDRE
jgi:hypothetical protein